MLSTVMHQYSPAFSPLGPSSSMDHGMNLRASCKPRHHPYDTQRMSSSLGVCQVNSNTPNGNGTPGPIRRRISRACDQCNQLRTKCDGKQPCQHCIDFTLKCEYARERKKRGKASRKDLQAAAAAAAAAGTPQGGSVSASSTTSASPTGTIRVLGEGTVQGANLPQAAPVRGSVHKSPIASNTTRSSINDIHDINNGSMHHHHIPQHHHHHLPTPDSPSHLQLHHHQQSLPHNGTSIPIGYERVPSFQHQLQSPNGVGGPRMLPQPLTSGPSAYGNEYSMIPHHQTHQLGTLSSPAPSSLTSLLGHSSDAGSPSWLPMPSPPQPILSSNVGVRYPVLLPLLPHINSIIPPILACDLLDRYFTNPSTTFFQPASPYVLTHIFRKRSFLHPTSPRPTSPALLCAMLWVAAQTCDTQFLTASPSPRGQVCQRLLELCIGLLRPLVHVNVRAAQHTYPTDGETGSMGAGLGDLGGGGSGGEGVGAAGTLDDVLTYIHLGVVISASEFKGASLRWWNTAWALARELHLNRELPPSEMELAPKQEEENHQSPTDSGPGSSHHPVAISEEEREERRRTWWLLYIMDRHLALCFNRPLAILDIECENLYLPIDEASWQNDDFYPEQHPTHMYQHGSPCAFGLWGGNNRQRTTGPVFEITGSGLFDYFLPLMVILGEIVDLHHARNRPRFGVPSGASLGGSFGTSTSGNESEERINEVCSHLDTYERSLRAFEAENCSRTEGGNLISAASPTPQSGIGVQSHSISEAELQSRVVLSYGNHVMHVLHILLIGKWDPVSMLDDNDLWISSPGFLSATAHAVSAAEAISDILKYDPDLSFMPYFFGIYLLQGSFLLLLITDKLHAEASEAVVSSCETIVRAHEVCVVTLNTEYQRNFCKVMRSALGQVRGRGLSEDIEEQKLRRREVLQLYRWCGDGTGLAL